MSTFLVRKLSATVIVRTRIVIKTSARCSIETTSKPSSWPPVTIGTEPVYCEKPLTLTIEEGRDVVSTAQATGVPFLLGSQQRSDWHFRTACELIRNGRLGKIFKATVTVDEKGAQGGPFAAQPVPKDLNWDQWLGQSPKAPYCPERRDGWHYWWEYGGGEMSNWGIHHVDIVQWALGFEHTGPRSIETQAELPHIANGYNIPRRFSADITYADGTLLSIQSSPKGNGILFEGDRGRIFVNREKLRGKPVEDLADTPLPPDAVKMHSSPASKSRTTVQHHSHFLRCVQVGEKPVSDVETAHRSTTICNLANLSMRLGRKLNWDSDTE